MAASGRKRVCFTVDVALPSETARTAFKDRLSSVRDLLTPAGCPKLDNLGLTSAFHGVFKNEFECWCSQLCWTRRKLFTLLRYVNKTQ